MLELYKTMFAHMSDTFAHRVDVSPPPSSEHLLSHWKEDLIQYTHELQKLAELDEEQGEALTSVQDLYFDSLSLFLKKAKHQRPPLDERKKAMEAALTRPQTAQRSTDWYLQALKILTASEFSSLYGSERGYANFVLSKALPPVQQEMKYRLACSSQELGPMDWGTRFEPVIKQALATNWGFRVVDSGRLIHPTDTSLAASPDGFIVEATDPAHVGRLIEIKCPITRKIGEGVPFDYWCQMQIQMEVADIDECLYIECRIASVHPKQPDYVRPETPFAEGLVWLLQAPDLQMTYAYTLEERDSLRVRGYEVVETIPWAIEEYASEIVQRDRTWFAGTATLRETFWANVEKAKRGEFKVPEPSAYLKKSKACLIQDTPPTPSVR
jgi:hypothetical protein